MHRAEPPVYGQLPSRGFTRERTRALFAACVDRTLSALSEISYYLDMGYAMGSREGTRRNRGSGVPCSETVLVQRRDVAGTCRVRECSSSWGDLRRQETGRS